VEEGEKGSSRRARGERIDGSIFPPGAAGCSGIPPPRLSHAARARATQTPPAQRSLRPREPPAPAGAPGWVLRAGGEWCHSCEAFIIHVSNFFPDSPQPFIEELGR